MATIILSLILARREGTGRVGSVTSGEGSQGRFQFLPQWATLSIEEQTTDRDKGIALAGQFKTLPWSDQMQALHNALVTDFIPRYQSHADAARTRNKADEEAICLYMVEHEKAQLEFARRELAGAGLAQSLEPVVKFLKYPIQR